MKKLFLALIIAIFFKQCVWLITIPLWHFPDEQAHFGQLAYMVEMNTLKLGAGAKIPEEIYLSERVLETNRDERGNNKFTHDVNYNITYTDTFSGQFEDFLKNLPLKTRSTMTISEATGYPPLFYLIAALPYKLFYDTDLFIRVFLARIISTILFTLSVFVAYKLYYLIFKGNKIMIISGTILVGFHPMFSFVGSGVNSDVLFNLFATIVIYLGLNILLTGLNAKNVLLSLLTLILSFYTKPQGYILIGFLAGPFLYQFVQSSLKTRITILSIGIGLILFDRNKIVTALTGGQFLPDIPSRSTSPVTDLPFGKHIVNTISHTYKEILPWYWGVFRWLSLTLPRIINRIINRVLLLASIGLLLQVIRTLYRKKVTREFTIFLYLFFVSMFYFFAITLYDYFFIRGHGFSFGVQGRYFFPTIVAHMGLILSGLIFFGRSPVWKERIAFGLACGMIFLHWIAFYSVVSSYYDLRLPLFIHQVSQYKPFFAKYPWYIIWFLTSVLSLAYFLYLFSFMLFKGKKQFTLYDNK